MQWLSLNSKTIFSACLLCHNFFYCTILDDKTKKIKQYVCDVMTIPKIVNYLDLNFFAFVTFFGSKKKESFYTHAFIWSVLIFTFFSIVKHIILNHITAINCRCVSRNLFRLSPSIPFFGRTAATTTVVFQCVYLSVFLCIV